MPPQQDGAMPDDERVSVPPSPRPPSPRPPSPRTPPRTPSPRPPSPHPPSPPISPRHSSAPPGSDDSPSRSGRSVPPHDGYNYPPAYLPSLKMSVRFARMVREASLDSQFSPEELDVLRNPQECSESSPEDDPHLRFSIRNFIDLLGCSQDSYSRVRENVRELFPETPVLSYNQVKRRVRRLSGVVTWEHHMCVGGCIGFTGPFSTLDSCPECGEPRYDQKKLEATEGILKIPRKVFTTFPVGPQLQARWKDSRMAEKMSYRWQKTQELRQEREESGSIAGDYDDILSGDAYLEAVENGTIGEHDTVLMFSIDGAQLYRHKKSDCWLYIWILLDLAPEERYKVRNILPGGVIPGPESPGNIESFLFPGLAHLSTIQKEGLKIWDAYHQRMVLSFTFLLLVLADAVAMAVLSGSVGHHGRKGCRLLCGFVGRNKIRGAHYYPALLLPSYPEANRTSSHPDVDISDLPDADPQQYRADLDFIITSQNPTEFSRRRFDTGISKPSIFDGVPRVLQLPTCFAGDLMHQPVINIAALLFDLWCARPDLRSADRSSPWPWAVLTGDVWNDHGKVVGRASTFLPTSFGRPPRNPQEKISSGYKAWEFLYYLYGLGPGVFFNVLPQPYFSHFCKLVRAIRVIYQRRISREQVILAHKLLLEWCVEFEELYYQRNPERLHFVRQCVHSLTHLAKETCRLGPLSLSSQWTMERIIGVLGSQLRQPSNPYANITAQAQKMAHVNAMVAIWPSFEKITENPRGSVNLGDGYLLLRPMDGPYHLSQKEEEAFDIFCSDLYSPQDIDRGSVNRWGRLRLPTEQVARSVWKELERCSGMARTDRNVKVYESIISRTPLM